MTLPPFSLVSTVFNEIDKIDQTISDINKQTLKPTEIIIVDAGSTDGTFERLNKWTSETTIPITILQQKKCNVAQGRNLAIINTKYEIIVSTDFGCRFHQDWLKSLIEPFYNSGAQVVAGSFSAVIPAKPTLLNKADYILSNQYKINLDKYFVASSRSIAYYKSVWEKLGGYCEWLTLAADDTIFWRMIVAQNIPYHLVSDAYVYWGRHNTLRAFGRETFRYGLGDGEAKINFRNFLSLCVETALRYFLFAGLLSFIFIPSFYFIILSPCLLGLRSYKFAFNKWKNSKNDYNSKVLFFCIILIETTRINYLKGYLKGLIFANEKQKAGRKILRKMNIK